MKKILLFSILLFTCLHSNSQEYLITGKVLDSTSSQGLSSATIFIESPKDSTLLNYTISNNSGNFELLFKTKEASSRLNISYTGMQAYSRLIDLTTNKIDLGNIQLKELASNLDEVIVNVNRSPITIKKDTLEFNAASFKTRPDANLEETLKQLPGVEVDAAGNITVNGKPVQRILVNGKEFFGNDPKIATKNLPKEIINKIQVVDTKTQSQEFTGEEGDSENKTINITIDEDKNKGYFSRATIGGGTDDRYEMSGIGNYFKDDLRLSVLASSNNINSSGFTFDEVFDAMGRRARTITRSSTGSFGINGLSFGNNKNGITKSETAGLNFVNEWNEKYEVSSDYFFGSNNTDTRTSTRRENILPDRTFFTNSESNSTRDNDSHRGNVNFSFKPDTLTRINIRPSININKGTTQSSSLSESLDDNQNLINTSETENRNENLNTTFSNDLSVTRKFGSRGAFLNFSLENENNKSESDNFFFSSRETFGNNPNTEIQNQLISEDNNSDMYQFETRYRSVMTDQLFLDIEYSYEVESSKNERSVFDFDENTNSYSDFNPELSNNFKVKGEIHIPNVGLRYEGDKLRTGFNVGLLNTQLRTENLIQNVEFNNDFNNLFASANLRYEFERSKRISIYYRNSNNIPSIQQLQPVRIQTDPLNFIEGNPNLKPSFNQNVNISFNNFDFKSRSGYGFYMSYGYVQDQVVSVSVTDEDLLRTTTFDNISGGQDANASFYYSKQFKAENKDTYRLRGNLSGQYAKTLGFTNGQQFESENYVVSPGLGLTYEKGEVITLNPTVGIDYNLRKYNINANRNEEFTNLNFSLEATTYWPKNVVFGNDITYFKYGNVAADFRSTSLQWNMSLGYQLLKDNATLKFKVYDLLDQNIGTRRQTGDDFVQDTDQLILERYFMLSFTYKFSKFGGKDPNASRMRFN
ncbi:outer membrane beta-barrel protein [Psychroflexus sp. CAK8W]|uniref:Outer membrane beta-barrel protein n=1 Tax=Psychroflexus longus TaxID=2873596 RepID=A0ABS7XH56_9FLAO|nr:outer membrane beta-barrel protein [Psychroflexus longus]MBZ9777347.1 outer membrane beta-barrel protein [Psychroflexus longus]